MIHIKRQGNRSVEKIVLSLYLFAHFILLIYMLKTHLYAGDFYDQNIPILLPDINLILFFIITVWGYVCFYWFYIKTSAIKIRIKYKFKINKNRFDIFYAVLLIIQTFFVINTGVGRVFSETTNKLSPIFSLLNVDCIFGIYYFTCRRKKTLYVFNIVLFVINNLVRGWSMVFLTLFFYELYFRAKKGAIKNVACGLWMSISPILILGGGFLYKIIFPLKQYIRMGYSSTIPFTEAVIKLVNRISFFSSSTLAFQNANYIKDLYFIQGIHLLEFKTLIRPILPRQLMPFKEFRIFSNLLLQSVYHDISITVSSEMGILSYIYCLLHTNLAEFLMWLICICLIGLFIKLLFQLFAEYDGQLNFLWFYFLIDIIKTGSLSALSFYYTYLIYMIPVLLIFGVIKITKQHQMLSGAVKICKN